MKAVIVLLATLFIIGTLATTGVDLSQPCSADDFKCIKSHGFDFAIIRIWQSNGQPDPNGPHTVQSAWDGGMSSVDLFPCPSCGNPEGQVEDAINDLKKVTDKYDTLWLDIEGPGLYWGGNQAANADFFAGLVKQAKAMGQKVGVYTSASQWIPIMGKYEGGSDLPLWYAHYDNNPSFSDFQPFGGWSKPDAKQYEGNINECGCGVDYNYTP